MWPAEFAVVVQEIKLILQTTQILLVQALVPQHAMQINMQLEVYAITALLTALLALVVQLIALHVLQIIICYTRGIALYVQTIKAIPSMETISPHAFTAHKRYLTVFIVKEFQIMFNAHIAITTMVTPIIWPIRVVNLAIAHVINAASAFATLVHKTPT